MFYEVRVFNSKGETQKVISRKELSQLFWKRFFANEQERNFSSMGGDVIPLKLKKRLRNAFPELYDVV